MNVKDFESAIDILADKFEGDVLHVQHIDFKNSKLYQLDIQPSRCVILSEPIDWKNIKHLYLNKKGERYG